MPLQANSDLGSLEPLDEAHAGPSYEDVCGLALSEQACPATDQANLAVLAAVAALDMQHAVSGRDDADTLSQDLQQLDNKLNVLIQMFATFWRQQCAFPPAHAVTVSADALRLDVTGPNDDGELLRQLESGQARSVSLYLHDALPQPLVLPLARCEVHQGGDTANWTLHFAQLSQELEDALARHVFRRHRRAVAQSRVLQPSSAGE